MVEIYFVGKKLLLVMSAAWMEIRKKVRKEFQFKNIRFELDNEESRRNFYELKVTLNFFTFEPIRFKKFIILIMSGTRNRD